MPDVFDQVAEKGDVFDQVAPEGRGPVFGTVTKGREKPSQPIGIAENINDLMMGAGHAIMNQPTSFGLAGLLGLRPKDTTKPLVNIPSLPLISKSPDFVSQLVSRLAPNLVGGAEKKLGEIATGMTVPDLAPALVAAPESKLVQALFAVQGAAGLPSSVQEFREAKDTVGKAGAVTGGLGNLLMAVAPALDTLRGGTVKPLPGQPGVEVVPPGGKPATPPPIPPDTGRLDLEALVKEKVLPADVLEPPTRTITRKPATPGNELAARSRAEVGGQIRRLETAVRMAGQPGELAALRAEAQRLKLTDGQWLRLLQEWQRGREAEPKAAGETPSPQPSTGPEQAGGHPPLPEGPGVLPLVLRPLGGAEVNRPIGEVKRFAGEEQARQKERTAEIMEPPPEPPIAAAMRFFDAQRGIVQPLEIKQPEERIVSEKERQEKGQLQQGQGQQKVLLEDLLPAIDVPGRDPLVATPEQITHDDVLKAAGRDPELTPYESPRRIFVNPKTGQKFSRLEAEAATGVKGSATERGHPTGGLDSLDLPRAKGAEAQATATPPPTPPPSQPTPLRSQVEGEKEFLHRVNNFAQKLASATTLQSARRQTKEISELYRQGRTDEAEIRLSAAEAAFEMNQETQGSFVPLPKGLTAKLGPAQGPVDMQQLYGRLRNKLGEGSMAWSVLDTPEFREFMQGRKTMEQFGKWVEEHTPRVEVKTSEGITAMSPIQREHAELSHWADTLSAAPSKRAEMFRYIRGERVTRPAWISDPETIRKVDRLRELDSKEEAFSRPVSQVHWSSIAPKPESEMPGYVEGAVVVPKGRVVGPTTPGMRESGRADFFPSSHSFPPNTLGFFRGYMETRPDGGKTFHVIEVQSDWAAQQREYHEALKEWEKDKSRGMPDYKDKSDSEHPLLRDWERLTLKAAIDHAVKEGADRVAVQDAKSAMMMEGHDRAATLHGRRYLAERQGGTIHEVAPDTYKVISQEQGMRLHYDTILPRLAAELTGSEGGRVGFGEHKMAFEQRQNQVFNRPLSTDEVREANQPRKDLIFREPTGEPKTTVTAREFSLDKVKARGTEFSTLTKDRMEGQVPTSTGYAKLREGLSPQAQKEFDALKFGDQNTNGLELAQRIAANPEVFGKDQAALAQFLVDHHGYNLATAKVLFEPSPVARSAYAPSRHAIFVSPETSVSFGKDALHEGTHAATHWGLLYPKTPKQRAAAAVVWDILEQAKNQLPPEVRQFWDENYRPIQESAAGTNELWSEVHKKGHAELGSAKYKGWSSIMYAMRNPSEFMAMSFSDGMVQNWLRSWKYKQRSAWESFKDAVKGLLGVPKDSAFDRMLDSVIELGKEPMSHSEELGMARLGILTAPPPNPSTVPVLHDLTWGERWDRLRNKVAGFTVPRTLAASENTANKLVRYGSARIAAPLVARSLATEVLGKQYKNPRFARVLGAVIVEDQLRGVKQGFLDAAAKATGAERDELLAKAAQVTTLVGRRDSPLRGEIQFRTLLAAPEIAAAIERHKAMIQPVAEQAHTTVGGKLAQGGENTGAFANLIAILNPDDVESVRGLVYGSRQGDITNPLKRGSVFSKQRAGTAQHGYVTDYRTIAERMIRGNYEQKALRDTYQAYIDAGLAVEEKPGVPPPTTLGGQATEKVPIEIRGGGPGQTIRKNLWVRADLAGELKQALSTDSRFQRGAVNMLLNAVTDLQIIGLTDAWWHTGNMFGAIATSQGGRNLLVDALRKLPGLNVIDTTSRIVHNAYRVFMDHPEVQAELAKIAEVGAGRTEQMHKGYIAKGLEKVGVPDPMNPALWSNFFIRLVDKAGRVTLNDMFSNLVERKLVEDSELNRREFINKMGQYNSRLMSKYQDTLRELSLSSFIVAGKNFNRLAVQKLLWDPGVRAVNHEAWVKMHLMEGLGWISTLVIVPVLMNKALTGTLYGRAGTPPGAIDTGKSDQNGRPITIDPLQTVLLRRAMRNVGAEAFVRGVFKEQLGKQEPLGEGIKRAFTGDAVRKDIDWKNVVQNMAADAFHGYIHPYTGPSVRTAKIAATGYDPNGYLLSRNPDSMWDNLKAAVWNANPMISAYMRGQEQQSGGGAELATSLGGAVGVKKGKLPSLEARYEQISGKEMGDLSLPERRKVQKQIDKERARQPNLNVEAEREGAIRNTLKNFARQDAIRGSLSRPSQEWLTTNKLKLPGFAEELTLDSEKLPLTHGEANKFMDLVTRHYEERITALMASPLVDKWKQEGVLQKRLNARLTLARERARAELRRSINQGAASHAPPPPSPSGLVSP